MKFGVITDCFKKPLDECIVSAAKMGFNGVQIYATYGDFSPEKLTDEDKAHYKKLLKDNNLEVSALCGDLGGHGFEIEADNAERVKKTERIIDLAAEFGAKAVTTHIGVIPADKTDPQYGVMLRALTACGKYALKKGVKLAIETGPEIAPTLYAFVSDTEGGVGVNLDPANFVMVSGQDPAEAVYLLKDFIVHTHLKDGRRLRKIDPKIIYNSFAEGGIEGLNAADYFIETPVGEGDVDFEKYFAALKDIGYDGYLTVERETGDDPEADIAKAMRFLRAAGV